MLKGRYFCTSGLSLETVILPVDESPDSLERAKATGYSLHELVGKVSLVFLCSAHPALLRAGAVMTGANNSTGFPISDLVNTKFTSKDNIVPARQWLKVIWLSLGAWSTKNRVILKEGAALEPATTVFLGRLGGPCSGLQRVWGEKPDIRGWVGSQGWEKLWTSSEVPQGWAGAQKEENWL